MTSDNNNIVGINAAGNIAGRAGASLTGTFFEMGATPVLEQAMRFGEARHRLILSNIANADTPLYRRQDLDPSRFQQALSEAVAERAAQHPGAFRMTESAARASYDRAGFPTPIRAPFPSLDSPLRHDESNVSLEREMALLAKNGGSYSTYAALYGKGLRQMRAAISGRADQT